MRLGSTSFPLLEANDETTFDLLSHLRQLQFHLPGEWPVRFKANRKHWSARVCAIRKSTHAAEKSKKKLLKQASRKQTGLRPEALECAEYIFVLTSLPPDVVYARGVLNLYRARWQMELCFKRLKPLLRLGHVPKYNDLSARIPAQFSWRSPALPDGGKHLSQ